MSLHSKKENVGSNFENNIVERNNQKSKTLNINHKTNMHNIKNNNGSRCFNANNKRVINSHMVITFYKIQD